MARVIFSGIGVTQMRGKIGNEVFFKNRAGAAVRSYAVPTQPNTSAQLTARSYMATIISQWQGLSDFQREQWRLLATRQLKRNGVGNRKNLSSYQMFVRSNLALAFVGLSPITTPDLFGEIIPVKELVFGLVDGSHLEVAALLIDDSPIIPAGFSFSISASPCVSPGIHSPKNFFQVIHFSQGLFDTTADYAASYLGKFPALTAGQRLFVRAHVVNNSNGLYSTAVTNQIVVS